MRSKFNVTGLASAATIWALGSLGVLIGSGHMLLALLAALIMFFLLRLIPKLEHAHFHQRYCLHTRAVVRHEKPYPGAAVLDGAPDLHIPFTDRAGGGSGSTDPKRVRHRIAPTTSRIATWSWWGSRSHR